MENDDSGIECLKCKKKIGDADFDNIIFLDPCSHIVCKDCLKMIIAESYPEVECPQDDCQEKIKEFEIK